MKLYIINAPFDNWKFHLYNNFYVKYIENYHDLDKSSDYKIIPICQNDFVRYTSKELLFTNDTTIVNILNNKGLFAKFMMQYFNEYIPKTIYFNVNDKEIYDSKITLQKMIQKPTLGYASQNTKIINEITKNKNIVVSECIIHDVIYVGHFLFVNNTLIDKIYFYKNINKNCIYKGLIRQYKVCNELFCDDGIFIEIFKKLGYSGFSCIDFTICNNKIYIFEINPRIGGSLIFNIKYLNKFLYSLVSNIKLCIE
jgi:predicted ATP-grasp superfamily ATP-dependent carboligase